MNLLEYREELRKNRNSRSTTHVVNPVGSTVCTYPTKLTAGDFLRFNVTNTTTATKHTGTMLTYTFPVDCEVIIYAVGARGGKGNKCTDEQVGKGANAQGVFNFKKGDTLLMCVGQAGTDFSGSYSDGATGAGGGGTFVCLKMENGIGSTYTGSGVGNGWVIKPILIGAGGNGGRDVGYSSSGTIYHGQGFGGSSPTYATYSGGGFAYSHTTTNAGETFLSGASGATANYTRSSTSYAGFGCGGGNKDDGEGGGGGGYHGGTLTVSAYSYIDTELAGLYHSIAGDNFGEGYIEIEFMQISGASVRANVNGTWKESKEVKVNVNDTWKDAKQIFVNVNGTWKESI